MMLYRLGPGGGEGEGRGRGITPGNDPRELDNLKKIRIQFPTHVTQFCV